MDRLQSLKQVGKVGLISLAFAVSTAAGAKEQPHEAIKHLQDSIELADATLEYTVAAGELLIHNNAGEPRATLSYVAYTLDDVEATQRPLTFFWDGGPGGATFAENFLGFGPKRYFPDRHQHAGAPYELHPNPYTLLPVSDLVFIDPVGTGYSRALGDYVNEDYWGVEADADAMSAAIIQYLRQNQRWQSPKFLLGSSYGTTRASIMADQLQSYGLALNGVILVGSALNFGMQDLGMDQAFTLTLPTLAAIAWHHGKTAHQSKPLPVFLQEVEDFVQKKYVPALYLGNQLSAADKGNLANTLAGYIGLSPRYIHDAHLRVSAVRFRKELLRDQEQTISRMDGRKPAADFDSVGEEPEDDYWLLQELLLPARVIVEDFYSRELGLDTAQSYNLVAPGAIQVWNWDHQLPNIAGVSNLEIQERNIFPQNTWVAAHLARAMRSNRNLRVFQAHGYFDLATPYAWGNYDLAHMTHDPQVMDRITIANYEAGHVIFFDDQSLPRMHRDLRAFYERALQPHHQTTVD